MRREVKVDGFGRDDGGVDEAQEDEATDTVQRREVSKYKKLKEENRTHAVKTDSGKRSPTTSPMWAQMSRMAGGT